MPDNLVLTRPAGSNFQLRQVLQAAGVRIVEMPLIEITARVPLVTHEPFSDAPSAPRTFIFTSQNAVQHAPQIIARLQNQPSTDVFAVGAATQEMLARQNIQAQAPARPGSEYLLNLKGLQHVLGQKITIVTGRSPRGLLESALVERGAVVNSYECYERHPLQPVLLAQHLEQGHFDHVLVTSVDILQALMGCLGQGFASKVTLVVTAARIAEAAFSEGFNQLIEARDASAAGVLDAMQRAGPDGEMWTHE